METYNQTPSMLLLLALLLSCSSYWQWGEATTFTIRNNCGYTIWPASLPALNGGGTTLAPGQTWTVSANTFQGRFWARTGCQFDGSGRGPPCATGDCGGVLRCNGAGGVPPTSLAEFALNSWSNLDFYDVSYVDGYDIPVDITPTRGGCPVGGLCHYDLKSNCPGNLQVRNSNGAVVACRQGDGFRPVCKAACKMAYCFDTDDINTLSCPYGTNYNIVFCPAWSSSRANISSEAILVESS